jgi:hypothetical protein
MLDACLITLMRALPDARCVPDNRPLMRARPLSFSLHSLLYALCGAPLRCSQRGCVWVQCVSHVCVWVLCVSHVCACVCWRAGLSAVSKLTAHAIVTVALFALIVRGDPFTTTLVFRPLSSPSNVNALLRISTSSSSSSNSKGLLRSNLTSRRARYGRK